MAAKQVQVIISPALGSTARLVFRWRIMTKQLYFGVVCPKNMVTEVLWFVAALKA